MTYSTYKININGVVQGVGFRPFIYTLASKLGLKGKISNGASGVEIYINATTVQLKEFLDKINKHKPSLSQIDNIIHIKVDNQIFENFTIEKSDSGGEKTVKIPPDLYVCKECQSELFDPNNRRFNYPFITCTQCGVRYSIITNLPYDREFTSMSSFKMCKACKEEYNDPTNRRYHAQPIGCFDCGPKLSWFENDTWQKSDKEYSVFIDKAVDAIKNGKIVAIKGVGGYHLVCDATNSDAVKTLRDRKNRPSKPFAIMTNDINMAKNLAEISTNEELLLNSPQRPIVLLKALPDISKEISTFVAPNINTIGVFLPYTPLHLLLMNKLNRPLIATSANISDEPLCINLESLKKLKNVYDAILDHNREIVNGCDDSVAMVVKEKTVMLRRARGYAPLSIKLPSVLKENILAFGANQKNTIAIGFGNDVVLSPHIGDLGNIESVNYLKSNVETFTKLYDFKPDIVLYDFHPQYESTKFAKENYKNTQGVWHHHAHILSVVAEHKIELPVLGVAFDGTGYGEDGTLWGGEFLVCNKNGFDRVLSLEPFLLLGGEKAIKEPRRVALSILFDIYGKEAINLNNHVISAFEKNELENFYTMYEKKINSPKTSSMGRLFDAVASMLNVCQIITFEGESGMRLEELFDKNIKEYYEFDVINKKIQIDKIIKSILREKDKKIAVSKFFRTIVEIINFVQQDYKNMPLVLSGGVFQNRILLSLLIEKFPNIYFAQAIPPNDGGIALGQIASMMNLD
ncbi:MAG: carbamoyltransferase HypF [Sulfurovaceae bacterium]|nr:carbamoyltransferase HypF [Sulfurovaceae bacterium]MDD5548179.1 carbamoyltransferase HypF [Sulfurovaceae bacterium]